MYWLTVAASLEGLDFKQTFVQVVVNLECGDIGKAFRTSDVEISQPASRYHIGYVESDPCMTTALAYADE